MDRRQNVIGGRIHGLTAADYIVNTQVDKQLLNAFTGCNCDKAVFFVRIDCLIWEGWLAFCFQINQLVVVAMLYLHVVDLHVGQVSQLERRLDGVAWFVGMYMTLDNLLVIYNNDTVADRLQICAQRQRVCIWLLFIDDKLGAVAEVNIFFVKFGSDALSALLLWSGLCFLLGGNDLSALDDRQHTLPDLNKALAACIDDACLFEYRQHLWGLRQRVLSCRKDFLPHLDSGDFLLLLCYLLCMFACQAGNGQDGTFGRFHNRFIGSGYAQSQRICQVLGIGSLLALQSLGKSAEQQRQDNARVSSCASEQCGGCLFGHLLHCRLILEQLQLTFGSVDGHRHVGAGVTVRYREYVERVHLLTAIRNAVCARDKRISELTSLYHN